MKIGYCFTGSFCTLSRSLAAMKEIVLSGHSVVPIMSERIFSTDTRFTPASAFVKEVEDVCGSSVIHTIVDAEPIGPRGMLDLLVVAPCTGNTLAKVSSGITDSAATMAIKSHLRADRPVLFALASNDAMSQNLANLARLLARKATYFVPMRQDDPRGKPHSLVAEFERIPECVTLALEGKQVRPIFL